jgi:hypothetical protein
MQVMMVQHVSCMVVRLLVVHEKGCRVPIITIMTIFISIPYPSCYVPFSAMWCYSIANHITVLRCYLPVPLLRFKAKAMPILHLRLRLR